MSTKNKEIYDAPSTKAVEVRIEGMICTSGNADASMPDVFIEEDLEPGLF